MNKIINKNILDIENGIIMHQVNCQGVAGAGLAKQIAGKWPEWFKYHKWLNPILGDVSAFFVKPKICIVSLFAQNNYGRNERHTNYAALGHALQRFLNNYDLNLPVYIPHGIGCGLGGGNWDIVREIIYDALPDAIIVKWDGK